MRRYHTTFEHIGVGADAMRLKSSDDGLIRRTARVAGNVVISAWQLLHEHKCDRVALFAQELRVKEFDPRPDARAVRVYAPVRTQGETIGR